MIPFCSRKIHDVYAALASSLNKLKRADVPPADVLIEKWRIQREGIQTLDNRFEARVLGTQETELTYSWSDAFAYRLKNVSLAGSAGHVFFRDGSLFNVDPLTRVIKKDRTVRRPIRCFARVEKGPLLHLCGPNSENHGHFILDYLPKVVLLLERFRAAPGARILLSPNRKKWQCRYLSHFGIDPARVIEMDHGTLETDELWYAPILHSENGIAKLSDPANHLSVRAALSQKPLPQQMPLCIFASRLDAPNKKLLNEERLSERAREILGDVRIVKLSEHTLEEQLRLFASATVIIGAVGQNMTNVLFASGKLVLTMTLEENLWPGKRSWGRAYHNLALLNGNKAVLMLRDTPEDANHNWNFDEDRFAATLKLSWELFQRGGA